MLTISEILGIEKEKLERSMLGIPLTDDDLVFSHVDGRPLLPNTVTHAWIKLVRRTGLNNIRLHDARHSHASLMLKQGIHPKIVQERLGHSSVQITLDSTLTRHLAPSIMERLMKEGLKITLIKRSISKLLATFSYVYLGKALLEAL